MKKQMISNRFLLICFCIFMFLFVFVMVNVYLYVKASQLKIVEEISSSDSTLLQEEFEIKLPPQAEITCSGYCSDSIVIRIEEVEDLSFFLTNSLHLELDKESLQMLTNKISRSINGDSNLYKDMYGTEHHSSFFSNSKYRSNLIDPSTMTSFFLLDGKLIIEIKKSDVTTAKREDIKKIYY